MNWLHAHLPVLPVLLPLLAAVVLLAGRTASPARALRRQRAIGLAFTAAGLAVALALASGAAGGDLRVYRVGDWPAPYGIVLVVDRLSALMLVLTHLVALPVLVYAGTGWDARGRHFHALFQFQLMGLAGAFVTGDLFNLFVFFEVLLIASYALLVHGQGAERFRHGMAYVVLNLAGSAVFLIGIALVYAVTGTLNLAELALRVPRLASTDGATMVQAGGMLLLVVFGLKAALVPLHLWLPATYASASAPVAALFSLMTKVGVYAIIRVHGGVFGPDAAGSPSLVEACLLPLALASCVLGALGALAATSLPRLVGWLNVASVGTILVAVGLLTPQGGSAAIYYMAQSTLVIAALFLWAEVVGRQRGDASDRLEPGRTLAQPALLGSMLLLAGASVVGLPPLPGFLGKVMILGAAEGAVRPWVWATLLGVGFLTLVTVARAGSILLWSARVDDTAAAPLAGRRALGATAGLLAMLALMSAAGGPLQRYTDAAGRQLGDRDAYAQAVLQGREGSTVRPYRGGAGR